MNQNSHPRPSNDGGQLILGIFKAGLKIVQIALAVILGLFGVGVVAAFFLEDPAPVGAQRTTGLIVVGSIATFGAAVSFKLVQSALRKPKAAPQVEAERPAQK